VFTTEIRETAQRFSPFVRGRIGRRGYSGYVHPKFHPSDKEPIIRAGDDDAICVNEVMDMADKARMRELPDHYSYIVTKRLIMVSTEKWGSPSHDLLGKVYDILVREVNKMTDDHFRRFRYGGLHQRVKSIVSEVLVGCQALASQKIDWLLDMENKAPFTANENYLGDYREKFLTSYRGAERYEGDYMEEVAYEVGYAEDTEEVALCQVSRTPPRDPYEPALHHMASARAYFQVAFKRFTDMVPMTIDQELLRGLDWDRGLYSALTKGLEITGPGSLDKAKEYLQEPPDIVRSRDNLLKKRDRLQSAKRELQSL